MKGQNYYVDDDLKNNERNVLSSIYRTKHVFFCIFNKKIFRCRSPPFIRFENETN